MNRATPLRRALEALLSPLQAGHPDEWRDHVNRELRTLTGSDVAFFRVSDGSPTRVDPLNADIVETRNAYREGGFRTLDPWAAQRTRPGEVVLGTFDTLLGRDWRRDNPYWESLLRPRRITDYLGVQLGTDPSGHVVLSCFDVGRSRSRQQLERNTRLLRALVPALEVGVGVWLGVRPWFPEFGAMVDEVPDAVLLCDDEGRTVHANSALVRLVAADPEPHRLRDGLRTIARELARARDGDVHALHRSGRERAMRTPRGEYRVRPVSGDGVLRGDRPGGVLLMVRGPDSRTGGGGGIVMKGNA